MCSQLVLPLSDLGRNSKESLLSCTNCKALSLDISVLVGVMHKYLEANKVILFDEVVTPIWVKQDCEAELCVGAVYLVQLEFFGFASIFPGEKV